MTRLLERNPDARAARPPSAAEGEDAFLAELGGRVRALRARRGMSRRTLADASGVSERYLAALESGRGNVSVLLLRQIAAALSLPVGDLLREPDPRSLELRTHCQTSGISLSAQDPLNNVVRTAFEALSAVLGGTQSLHTNAFDEALALPSDASARVARATQLILQHETGVPGVVDPLAGSYFVERLTADLAAGARRVLEQIEAAGGMVRAIESGLGQRLIETAAAERQARVDRREDVVVGVNRFQSAEQPDIALRHIDSARVRERLVDDATASFHGVVDAADVRAALRSACPGVAP